MYLMHTSDFQLFGRMKARKAGRKIENIVARSPCVLHLSSLSYYRGSKLLALSTNVDEARGCSWRITRFMTQLLLIMGCTLEENGCLVMEEPRLSLAEGLLRLFKSPPLTCTHISLLSSGKLNLT